jgi:hypothetical protein
MKQGCVIATAAAAISTTGGKVGMKKRKSQWPQ